MLGVRGWRIQSMTVPALTIDFAISMRQQELSAIMRPQTSPSNWSAAITRKRAMCCLTEVLFGKYRGILYFKVQNNQICIKVTTTGVLKMPKLSAECLGTTQQILLQLADLNTAMYLKTSYWMIFIAMGMKQTFLCVLAD